MVDNKLNDNAKLEFLLHKARSPTFAFVDFGQIRFKQAFEVFENRRVGFWVQRILYA
jgi:hypothetical protein